MNRYIVKYRKCFDSEEDLYMMIYALTKEHAVDVFERINIGVLWEVV